MLLKEAWDDISSSIISGCWVHSRCLPVVEAAQVVIEGRDYHKEVERDTISEMCATLSRVDLNDTASMGLDLSVHDTAACMLKQWLDLEEKGMHDEEDDEGDNELSFEEPLQPSDKICLKKQALPLLQELHGIYAKLSDFKNIDIVREMCIDYGLSYCSIVYCFHCCILRTELLFHGVLFSFCALLYLY